PLADLLRAQTVVVQNRLIDTRNEPAPEGWRQAESTDRVVVWKRIDPLPYPGGRVSSTPNGLRVDSDRMTGDVSEEVKFSGANGGSVVFARLAWPGYEAKINGKDVPVRLGPAGLATVDLPKDVSTGTLEITWVMPGLGIGIATGAAGLLITVVLGFVDWSQRRRRRDGSDVDGPVSTELDDQKLVTAGTGERQ
ncbi:MAG TPA: hypothetical protein VNO31_03660, partial [Umezawaea sp.]|nr:hypothetical protein [Umezawaea sp.]